MSALLEQSPDELDFLVGAKIHKVEVERDALGEDALVLRIETRDPVDGGGGTVSKFVSVQVWQDIEGNGPGYLALTGVGR